MLLGSGKRQTLQPTIKMERIVLNSIKSICQNHTTIHYYNEHTTIMKIVSMIELV